MVAKQRAPVRPEVLRWVRESAGVEPEEAARRIGVSVPRLLQAEAGEVELTLIQARKAAGVYERPFAVLFLPSPPDEDPIDVQFRRFRDAPALPWASAMRALGRQVPALQEEADALFEAIEEEPRWREAIDLFRSIPDLARLGEAVRQLVGVSLNDQKAAARTDPQGFKAFRIWREGIESLGILVLQDGSLTLDEMRGFASPHERVPAIVINTNDDIRARLFTMLHELAHVLSAEPDENRSDEFAALTLMPPVAFSSDFRSAPGGTLVERIDWTARTYAVTPDAVAVRLGWLGLVAWPEVTHARDEIRRRRGAPVRAKGGNHYRNVVVRMGPGFVGRVLGAVSQGALSELGAARLLGVRVEGLLPLRKELQGSDVA